MSYNQILKSIPTCKGRFENKRRKTTKERKSKTYQCTKKVLSHMKKKENRKLVCPYVGHFDLLNMVEEPFFRCIDTVSLNQSR